MTVMKILLKFSQSLNRFIKRNKTVLTPPPHPGSDRVKIYIY